MQKPRLENTQNGEVIKSRLADLEEVKEWYHIATWLDVESVGWNPFQKAGRQKSWSDMKKRMNPFFLQAVSCYFLFMSFHLKNWADDIEAREWSIATAMGNSYLQYFRANARFPSFGGFGRLPRGTCHTGSLGLDGFITIMVYHLPLVICQWLCYATSARVPARLEGRPHRPHPFPSVRTWIENFSLLRFATVLVKIWNHRRRHLLRWQVFRNEQKLIGSVKMTLRYFGAL